MLELIDLKKVYRTKKGVEQIALNKINLSFSYKGFVVVLGKSGSGKTTLMNLLGGLDQFDKGEIIIKGKSSNDFNAFDWDSYRNTYCGFVFQEFNIINDFTVYKNISLVLELQGYNKSEIPAKVNEILKTVELEEYVQRYPNELSGGQKQRIAIARALIKNPDIILADEPTGNLDSETGKNIMQILKKISKDKLIIMVTHDRDFAERYADRIIELKDGQVVNDYFTFLIDRSKEKNQMKKDDLLSKNDDIEDKKLNLIKSKFALKNALKIAFNGLFQKKFRLILTLFLLICTMTLFGVALNFNRYNVNKASIITFKEQGISNIDIKKFNEICYDTSCHKSIIFTEEEDVKELRVKFPDLNFYITKELDFNIQEFKDNDEPVEWDSYYTTAINYVTYIDNKFKGNLIGTNSEYPTTSEEILITDYTAEMFLYFKVFSGVSNINDLIDKELILNNNKLKISGILDTAFTREMFEDYSLYAYMKYELSTIYGLESSEDNISKMNYNFKINNDLNLLKYRSGVASNIKINNINKYQINDLNIVGEYPNEKNEVLISLNYLRFLNDGIYKDINEMIGEEVIVEFYKQRVNTLLSIDEVLGKIQKQYKIVGIYDINYNNTNADLIVTNNQFIDLCNDASSIDKVLVEFSEKDSSNYNFISKLSYLGYIHETLYSSHIYDLENLSESTAPMVMFIAIALGIFSAIMIFTFISNNINLKRKEIGILRAIGSRGVDVAKIFVTESIIIGLIAAMLSTLLVKVSTYYIDKNIQGIMNNDFTILYLDYLSVIYIFLLSIGMVIISSLIPIIKIAKEQPIDAIRLK